MPEYLYPNSKSYRMLRGRAGPEGTLRKGYLFRVRQAQQNVVAPGSSFAGYSGTAPEMDPNHIKHFQYNPAELTFNTSAVPLDPNGSETEGGNLPPSKMQVGSASTALHLTFTRDQEVYNGTNFQGSDFGLLGTQVDLVQLFRIMLTDESSGLPLNTLSMKDLTGGMFDFASAGKGVPLSPIGVAFNDYLVMYGYVMSFSWSFPKFNNRLVPTMLAVDLSIDILNLSSAQQVVSSQGGSSDAGGYGNANPGGPGPNPAASGGANTPGGNGISRTVTSTPAATFRRGGITYL